MVLPVHGLSLVRWTPEVTFGNIHDAPELMDDLIIEVRIPIID